MRTANGISEIDSRAAFQCVTSSPPDPRRLESNNFFATSDTALPLLPERRWIRRRALPLPQHPAQHRTTTMLEDRRLAPLQGPMPTDFRRPAAGSRHNLAALRPELPDPPRSTTPPPCVPAALGMIAAATPEITTTNIHRYVTRKINDHHQPRVASVIPREARMRCLCHPSGDKFVLPLDIP